MKIQDAKIVDLDRLRDKKSVSPQGGMIPPVVRTPTNQYGIAIPPAPGDDDYVDLDPSSAPHERDRLSRLLEERREDFELFADLSGKQRAFLMAFSLHNNVGWACRQAKVDRSTVHRWRNDNPQFVEAYQVASEYAKDLMEELAYERAFLGWYEPVVQFGRVVAWTPKYDSKLAELLLKANNSEKFREKKDVNVSGTLTEVKVVELPQEAIDAL